MLILDRHRRHRSFGGPWRERPFRRGDIKYIILDFVKDRPSYGYEIIGALQERFHGLYVPSPGTVYPTLQMFEEMSYVTAAEQDGKKVYTITEEGRRFLSERKGFEERISTHIKSWWNPDNTDDISETMREFEKFTQLLRDKTRTADIEKLGRIRKVISRAHEDILKE